MTGHKGGNPKARLCPALAVSVKHDDDDVAAPLRNLPHHLRRGEIRQGPGARRRGGGGGRRRSACGAAAAAACAGPDPAEQRVRRGGALGGPPAAAAAWRRRRRQRVLSAVVVAVGRVLLLFPNVREVRWLVPLESAAAALVLRRWRMWCQIAVDVMCGGGRFG